MNEIFRFMSIRSAQLADPANAIDLSTYLKSPVNAAMPARAAAPRRLTPPRRRGPRPPLVSAYAADLAAPKVPTALRFAAIYNSLRNQITGPGFGPATTGSVVSAAIDKKTLATWVVAPSYVTDRHDAAIALIAAHLRPPADRTVDELAWCIRIMHLIDDLAAGKTITNSGALNHYLTALIMAPPNMLPLIEVGPPYNPFVIPAGVADLQIVTQELLGYEKREVSYIANVLQSETNKRVTVRFEKTDQTTTKSVDTTTQTEQDSQSSERFQVQQQAQKTIQDDSNLKFGISVSASYGPSVNVKSNFDYGSSQATASSNSASTSYGKDITTRSVSKVTQEVAEQQRVDIVNSFREKIIHGYDNTKGTGNISGVYQYVDALYEVGVFNYGTRLLLDVIIPDPGAFVRDAIKVANGGSSAAYNPPPIQFLPSDLTVPKILLPLYAAGPNVGQPNNNYPPIAQWRDPNPATGKGGSIDYTIQAQIYQAQGLKAPSPVSTIAKSYNGTSSTTTGAGSIAAVSDSLAIPDGYEAYSATVTASLAMMPPSPPAAPAYIPGKTYVVGDEVTFKGVGYVSLQAGNTGNDPDKSPTLWAQSWAYNLSVTIGNQFLQWGNRLWAGFLTNSVPADVGYVGSGTSFTVEGLGERGTIALSISCGVVMAYVVNVEVNCVMTNETFAQWQLDTFTTINQAYLSLLSNYQEASGQSQQGLSGGSYPGSSTDENTRVVKTELKREVISLVTLQQFDPPSAAPMYVASTTYSAGTIVAYNNVAYVSLLSNNLGNEPDISPLWWSTSISEFNAAKAAALYDNTIAYSAGAVVSYGGQLYVSLQGQNQGNEPNTSPASWAVDTATYVDPNLPPWSGQGAPTTTSAINFPVLFSEAPTIRFMEEAFEWEQMQYVYYPYYWSPKSKWFSLALIEDTDPLFAQFLRAGAARVVAPVRPGFEKAFLYYLQTGQPWDGGTPPQVYDPLYLSLAAEIEAADQRPVAETLIEPTWTMRLPTTLTMLRTNTPSVALYSSKVTYIIGSVVNSNGLVYMANQTPYQPGEPYNLGAVVSYGDAAYVSVQTAYVVATTYGLGDVVLYNGVTYTSLQTGNTGKLPDTSPAWWVVSLNTGNEPETSPEWWTATPNLDKEPSVSPAWWTPNDSSLPSWTLDAYLNVVAAN